MRKLTIERNYLMHPAGSCLICFGDTKIICTATLEMDVPRFLKGKNQGWVTAEYSMLPGSTGGGRKRRDGVHKDGRSVEIQRLIGRSLRASVDMAKMGSVSILLDCDVIQADGGTRTASISGSWVALYDALRKLSEIQNTEGPDYYLKGQVAAVSVGIVDNKTICDLDYKNDSTAQVDMNIVKCGDQLVEVQGTGEQGTFSRDQLNDMLDAADKGIDIIYQAQIGCLGIG